MLRRALSKRISGKAFSCSVSITDLNAFLQSPSLSHFSNAKFDRLYVSDLSHVHEYHQSIRAHGVYSFLLGECFL